MDRSKIPAAAFEWQLATNSKELIVRAEPNYARLGAPVWVWHISGSFPPELFSASSGLVLAMTGRNLTDTPQDALDSLSDEQMDMLEKLIEWVRGEG